MAVAAREEGEDMKEIDTHIAEVVTERPRGWGGRLWGHYGI